ncbi:MAG: nucleotidyltransferase family protein [Candidatus Stygibacter australis]|nr:nucleotidyltransferase family protein [Candidatus Stygibacter australis]MDP8321953.1 nucleotidyltransferase family protein [Candidatus Stygibacter australis]
MNLTSIILAAGNSTRMGTDKALLQIEGIAVVDIIIGKLQEFSSKIIIVTGENHQNLQEHLFTQNVEFVNNSQPELGMFSSLKLALKADALSTNYLIHLIDQPFIALDTYQILVSAIDDHHQLFLPVLTSQNRTGHPLIISPQVGGRILNASVSDNLSIIIKSLPESIIKRIPVDDPNILDNINTPQELKDKLTETGT